MKTRKRDKLGRLKCIDCGKWKSAADFYRLRKASEDRQSRCKVCDNLKRCGNYLRGPVMRGASGVAGRAPSRGRLIVERGPDGELITRRA